MATRHHRLLFLAGSVCITLLSSQERARTLSIHIYNRSTASEEEVSEMQTTAAAVFSRARFRVVWLHCLSASGELAQTPECNRQSDSTNISLTIINKWPGARSHDLGATTLGTGRATVYYQRVQLLAYMSDGRVSAGKLLGYAAAHEFAHLILGSSAHSAKGIFKATWSADDFRDMEENHFWFLGEFNRVP
jgi:hypothetical protein